MAAAEFGVLVLSGRSEAERFGQFLLSAAGQAVLARFGFESGLHKP